MSSIVLLTSAARVVDEARKRTRATRLTNMSRGGRWHHEKRGGSSDGAALQRSGFPASSRDPAYYTHDMSILEYGLPSCDISSCSDS